jgi:hypothetical protein
LAAITNAPFSAATINGTYSTQVISDTARGGLLDFVIQVTATTGSQNIGQVTSGNFTGFSITDAGYVTTGGTAGTAPVLTSPPGVRNPTSQDETLSGVAEFFFGGINSIAAGQTSDILVIQTNALAFTSGRIGIIDDTTASVTGFQPAPVPGPILGAGLPALFAACGGLIALARRRGKAAKV